MFLSLEFDSKLDGAVQKKHAPSKEAQMRKKFAVIYKPKSIVIRINRFDQYVNQCLTSTQQMCVAASP